MVGFSAFVSTGSMLDVNWGDLIDYFGDDPHTRSILIYMESVGDARAFLSAGARGVPKQAHHRHQGRSNRSRRKSRGITYRLAHGQRRRSGRSVSPVRRAASRSDFRPVFDGGCSGQTAPTPRPAPGDHYQRRRPAVLATDALLTSGGELAVLSPEMRTTLDSFLPAQWSHNNPIDVLGDAAPERVAKSD